MYFLQTIEVTRDFFFFQAEDGIRDRNVTGVQTCALPILLPRRHGDAPVAGCARRARTLRRRLSLPRRRHRTGRLARRSAVPTAVEHRPPGARRGPSRAGGGLAAA